MKLNLLTKKSIILGTALSICACAIPTYCVLASGKKNNNVSSAKTQQSNQEKDTKETETNQCDTFCVKGQREDGVFELELADTNNQSNSETKKVPQEKSDNNTSETSQDNVSQVKNKNDDGVFELEIPETKETLTIKKENS